MKKSSTFQGPQPNSRTFQDGYSKIQDLCKLDCTNHVGQTPKLNGHVPIFLGMGLCSRLLLWMNLWDNS